MICKYLKYISTFIFFSAISSATLADWRFYVSEKDGYYFLSEDTSKNPSCKGMKEASHQRFILNEFKYIRELCYEVSSSGKVKFIDPSKIFPFGRFEMKAENFIRIPTKQEQEAAEIKRRNEEIARSLYEANRPRPTAPLFSDNPTMLMIDGDMKLCHRIGAMVDCF